MMLQKYNNIFQTNADIFNTINSNQQTANVSIEDVFSEQKPSSQSQLKYYEYKQDERQLKIIELVKQSDSLNIFKQINFLIFELKSKKISDLSQSTLLSNNLRFLAKNNSIKRLKINLSNNPIGDIGIYDIVKQISDITSLEKIHLIFDYCSVTDKTVTKIVENFANLDKLKEINLSLNSTCVTENSVRTFYEFFQSKNKTIIADFKCNNLDVERHRKLLKKKENKFLDKSMRNQNIGSENYAEQFGDWQVTQQQSQQENPYTVKKQTPKEIIQQRNSFQQQPTNNYALLQQQVQQQQQQQQNENINTGSTIRQSPFIDSSPQVKEQDQRIKSKEEQEQDQELENKYGKGFKLLQQSGYQTGKGLGKNNDGRVEPVQANKKQFLGKPAKGQKNKNNNYNQNQEEGSYFEEKAQNQQQLTTFKDKGILEFKKTGTMIVGKQDSDEQGSDENDEENKNPNIIGKQNSSKKSSTTTKGSLQKISENQNQSNYNAPSLSSLNNNQQYQQPYTLQQQQPFYNQTNNGNAQYYPQQQYRQQQI